VPRPNVTIDGKQYDEHDPLGGLTAQMDEDKANHCSVTLAYQFDHEHSKFPNLPRKHLQPGSDVSISMGYGETGADTRVFTGSIETVETKFPAKESPRVVVTAYGPLREMMKGSHSRSWRNESLGRIVESVCQEYVKSAHVKGADLTLEHEVQHNESDYAFIEGLANRFGYRFSCYLEDVYFEPITGGTSPDDPVATLKYPESLESFSGTTTDPEYGEVEVRCRNERQDKTIVASATNDSGTGKHVVHSQVDSRKKAKEIAEAEIGAKRRTGYAETAGNPELQAGTVVSLKGVAPAYSGKHRVTEATHRFGKRGLTTDFKTSLIKSSQ